uniref:CD79a molecule, immunoglobulin-associated alpha n=1 Tax=Sphaeramia orbicularis TaxID=375764 RepID=A0A673CNR8_9TELE
MKRMGAVTVFLLCSSFVVITQCEVILEADRPSLKVQVSHRATLLCCYKTNGISKHCVWTKTVQNGTRTKAPTFVSNSDRVVVNNIDKDGEKVCSNLTFTSVTVYDRGLYRCWINASRVFTHGTYLRVYQPLQKIINLSEHTKNTILTVEGVLLLLCVMVPSVTLLCKSKRIRELEKKKMRKEEENIYQGLNLDDCCTTYDQIERSQAHGPYEDVGNMNADNIQLEKP